MKSVKNTNKLKKTKTKSITRNNKNKNKKSVKILKGGRNQNNNLNNHNLNLNNHNINNLNNYKLIKLTALIEKLRSQFQLKYPIELVNMVCNLMMVFDRSDFCNLSKVSIEDCYYDGANVIANQKNTETGDYSTISAPHMHFTALCELFHKLVPGSHTLDIGSGSGYLTACFAHMIETDTHTESKSVGVDVVSDLVRDSIKNVNKNHSHLFNKGNLQLVCCDGWKGYTVFEKYDAIHVGATVMDGQAPEELWNQLKPGGILFAPIRLHKEMESESIFVIQKSENCNEDCSVSYCNQLLREFRLRELRLRELRLREKDVYKVNNIPDNNIIQNEYCSVKKMMNVRYVPLRKKLKKNR